MNRTYVEYARIFKAMSDENRLRILDYLLERDMNASEILEKMDFGQSTLSHHMKLLLNSGIVQAHKNGKWMVYHLNKDAYDMMHKWMERYL